MTSAETTPTTTVHRQPAAPVRLFCFPHAGGGATAFRQWSDLLGPGIEVRPVVLPGRESRWRETPFSTMDQVVEGVWAELAAELRPPFALFGHSLGAAIAYELCRRFFADHTGNGSAPIRLLVSGRRAPHLSARQPPAHRMTDDGIVEYLRALNGVPPEVLANRDLLAAIMPALRADFRVNETYAPPRHPPLPVTVSAFLGEDDPAVRVNEMLCWRDVTSGGFSLRVFPGDHFYLNGGHRGLLAAIRDDLDVTSGSRNEVR